MNLNRAEGKIEECYGVVISALDNEPKFEGRWETIPGWHGASGAGPILTNDVEGTVLQVLEEWGQTAPKKAYDKVDFKVYWETGHSYGGRFDMSFGGVDGDETFFDSLKSRISFFIEMKNPGWPFSDEEWEKKVENLKQIHAGYFEQ